MSIQNMIRTAIIALIAASAIPVSLPAQQQAEAQRQKPVHHQYKLVDLGTFGGPHSSFNSGSSIINRSGTAVGGASASTPDPLCLFDFPYCFIFHAGKFENGEFSDLGSLPGGANNSIANAINSWGVVVGSSENGLIDPATGGPTGVATLWANGRVINLGTLGGSFSLAGAINDHNQIVGFAQNNLPDPFNFGALAGFPSSTQWRATLWQHGTIQDLGTLGDGTGSAATSVNERGQIIGVSFADSVVNPSTGYPTLAPFLWENGRMRNLGTLGGLMAFTSGLNNKGQVVGTSNLAGDQTSHPFLWERGLLRDLGTLGGSYGEAHWVNENGEVIGLSATANDEAYDGFLWRNGKMIDLGSVNGDGCSSANGINSSGQIVGESFSCSVDSHHAFLWENDGPAIDLNLFVPPGSDLHLIEAQFIGEGGEIAGAALLSNGDTHAFLLIPEEHDELNATIATETTQANAPSDVQTPTNVAHEPLTPEKLAALREKYTHRYRGFGIKLPKPTN
jgi:probable HAF family extracellular repeat protein